MARGSDRFKRPNNPAEGMGIGVDSALIWIGAKVISAVDGITSKISKGRAEESIPSKIECGIVGSLAVVASGIIVNAYYDDVFDVLVSMYEIGQ